MGIENGQHIKLHLEIDGNTVARNYTPISPVTQENTFEVVVKIYRPNTHPSFPNGGEFTPHLEKLEVG